MTKNYLDDEKNLHIILLGDTNDHGKKYWEGEGLQPFLYCDPNNPDTETKYTMKVSASSQPPNTCCITGSDDRNSIGDYVLVSENLQETPGKFNIIPPMLSEDYKVFPISDHLPVTAEFTISGDDRKELDITDINLYPKKPDGLDDFEELKIENIF